jgi:hypothetical protein
LAWITQHKSAGVNIHERIVQSVTEPIQALWVEQYGDERVGTQETAQLGGVKACAKLIDAQIRQLPLTREQTIGKHTARGKQCVSRSVIAHLTDDAATGIRHYKG